MGSITFDYQGRDLYYDPDTEMGSLTAMWDAAGRPDGKEPWRWLELDQAKEFIGVLCEKLNLVSNEVLRTERGRSGGTWGHRQIGMEYARYLSPQLAIRWNQIVEDVLYRGRTMVEISPAADVRALVSLGDDLSATIGVLIRTQDALKQFGIGIIETDERLTVIQPHIAELSRAVQKQIRASKLGYFYILNPDGRWDAEQVYIKTGTEINEGARAGDHKVTSVVASIKVRVPAIDPVACETIINNDKLPRFARQKGSRDHFPRLPHEVADHLVAWLKSLDELTVDKARAYNPPRGWWS